MTAERARVELAERLANRRPEIERAALARIHAISDPTEVADPEYADGLRTALTAALDFGLTVIERREDRAPAIPSALLVQARRAAHSGVSLDAVLRRYIAGYTLLGNFVIEEAEYAGLLQGVALKRVLKALATVFDRLIAIVTDEFAREMGRGPRSVEERRVESVKRLLAGELVETSELVYRFDACHLGMIAVGVAAPESLRRLADELGRRLLLVRRDGEVAWAWLGGRREVDRQSLERAVVSTWPVDCSLAIGEPACGVPGWRLTHQQARAALPIVLHSSQHLILYADVALLACTLQDDLFTTSLRQLYLAPLSRERDGGKAFRATLRAYFDSERNTSSAAAALGVSRQTVVNRLRGVEERIGRPIGSSATEIETALRLDDLGYLKLPYVPF